MRLRFGDFVFDRATRQLLLGGREQHLEPRAYQLLELLLLRRPDAVSKAEIQERLWPGTFVSESSLTRLVGQIRNALGDGPRQPQFLRTVHGYGYAFAAEVSAGSDARRPAAPVARVVWEGKVVALGPGENLLGRDEHAAVCIDAPGISRRHARIMVTGGEAVLEDLGSKNGTFLRERRLEAPAALRDGDTFRLGRHLLIYRFGIAAASTRTEAGTR
jgi:DNA-binding winged helix-turn-helix (wHTH) protein